MTIIIVIIIISLTFCQGWSFLGLVIIIVHHDDYCFPCFVAICPSVS